MLLEAELGSSGDRGAQVWGGRDLDQPQEQAGNHDNDDNEKFENDWSVYDFWRTSSISSVYFVNITLSDSVSDQSERNWPFYDGIKRRRQKSLVLLQVS